MFNLKKSQQLIDETQPLAHELEDVQKEVVKENRQDLQGQTPPANLNATDFNKGFDQKQRDAAKQMATSQMANTLMQEISKLEHGKEIMNRMKTDPTFVNFVNQVREMTNPQFMKDFIKDKKIEGLLPPMTHTNDLQSSATAIKNRANSINAMIGKNKKLFEDRRVIQQNEMNQTAFNLSNIKTAQVDSIVADPSAEAQFIQNYLPKLMSYDGEGKENDQISNSAKQEIISQVGQAVQEEVNSALQEIQVLDPNFDSEKAQDILSSVYRNWMPTKNQQEIVMSENKNIPLKVLSNSTDMIKTAADHLGNPYMLYGPSEKRICPKLRGKGGGQPGSGDVVSEYICRHHCLDGIVIDDNKTVCGEALWRANLMDKYSREYVDEDGNIVGGYLNKRFEINRNVPEENKMRLKPGELRKPRPPEWGNTESRMQAMRQKEAEQRNYKPDSNTGDPFDWAKDVDQNNVNTPQFSREKQESNSGHQQVDYTNKNKQENTPENKSATCNIPVKMGDSGKMSFNLKNYKYAYDMEDDDADGIDVPSTGDPLVDIGRAGGDVNVYKQIKQEKSNHFATPCENPDAEKRRHIANRLAKLFKTINFTPSELEVDLSTLTTDWGNCKLDVQQEVIDGAVSDMNILLHKLKDPRFQHKAFWANVNLQEAAKEAFDLKEQILDFGRPDLNDVHEAFQEAQGRLDYNDVEPESNAINPNDEMFQPYPNHSTFASVKKADGDQPLVSEGPTIKPKDEKIKSDDHFSRKPCSGCSREKKSSFNLSFYKEAKSPKGWKTTVEKMKDHPEIDNPFAIANWLKDEGAESHYNDKTGKMKKKYREESKKKI